MAPLTYMQRGITVKPEFTNVTDIPLAFNPEILASILGVSKGTAYQLANRADFPKIRAGRRIIIEKDSFLSWLNSKVGSEIA